MKKLTSLLVVLLWYAAIYAQTPQYSTPHTPDPLLGDRGTSPFDSPSNLWQSIYYPSNFPNMPAQGEITAVYVKISNNVPVGKNLYGLSIKLASTSLDSIPSTMYLAQQLLPCSQVYYNSVYNFATAKTPGEWMKLDLPTPFSYQFGGTDRKNLIVEVAQDSGTFANYDEVATYFVQYNLPGQRTIHDNKAHTQGAYANSNFLLVIGFDVQQTPTAIGAVNNEKNITVFPNPAKEILHIRNCQKKDYTITDITGRILQKGEIETDKININRLQQGLYFLRVGNEIIKFMKE